MDGKFIGSCIRTERQRLGWTQKRMANIGGVSKSSQVGYEAGARVPDCHYLRRVATEGADVMYLLFGERQQTSAVPSFNWNAHHQILKVIEEWLDSKQLTLRFDKKMELLVLFVAHFELTKRIDLGYVHETLKNAA